MPEPDRRVRPRAAGEGRACSPRPRPTALTLLRRLSLDLIGLPPTIEEVDAFLAETSRRTPTRSGSSGCSLRRTTANAGAGIWLDAARYADSDGYEKDKPRQVWFYRDWVIKALNRDLPYDQFVIEQIAGDLLPNATQDQIVATGFLRNSMINEEGGIDPEQFRMEAMFDRMDAIGKGMLGLTIQCAQCHNHKYDPLTQEEYYRMFAFLNNSHEANVAVYTPDEQMKRARDLPADPRDRGRAAAPHRRTGRSGWPRGKSTVKDESAGVDGRSSRRSTTSSTGGQKYLPHGRRLDPGRRAMRRRSISAKFTVEDRTCRTITAVRLELLNDPNLPLGGPGRSIKGTGALTEFEVEAAPADDPEKPMKVKIARATADVEPAGDASSRRSSTTRATSSRVTGPIEYAIDGKDETAWGIDAGPGRRNEPRKAVFVAEKPIEPRRRARC